MSYEIHELEQEDFPKLLFQIEDPPERLYMAGKLPGPETKVLCVVGSRKYSGYGREACERLITGLKGYDVAIVSGLAIGIDSVALETSLGVELLSIAIPGSGLHPDVLYPRTNFRLAERIVEAGGALLSEFEEKFQATPWSFPQRNRLMAGMSDATLIIEAGERSGTLITARLAMEYNRDVLVVPGGIFSQNAVGSNWLLKDGATPIFKSEDILEALDINPDLNSSKDPQTVRDRISDSLGEDERIVIELLREPLSKDELLENLISESDMTISRANILISSMEIKGIIKESYGKITTTF